MIHDNVVNISISSDMPADHIFFGFTTLQINQRGL